MMKVSLKLINSYIYYSIIYDAFGRGNAFINVASNTVLTPTWRELIKIQIMKIKFNSKTRPKSICYTGVYEKVKNKWATVDSDWRELIKVQNMSTNITTEAISYCYYTGYIFKTHIGRIKNLSPTFEELILV